jgi:ATP-dependent DNA helicase RecQ
VRLQRERNQRFGAGHLIDILLGKLTPRVQQQGHDSLTVFGIGTELTDMQWRGVVRQLLAQGLLAVNDDGFGTLVITESSGAVLSGARTVMMREEPKRPSRRSGARGAGIAKANADLDADAAALFQRLREWRADQARNQGVPAYVVFGDATLREFATARPGTLAELSGVTGVGQKKLETYGQAVLDVVSTVVGGRPPQQG